MRKICTLTAILFVLSLPAFAQDTKKAPETKKAPVVKVVGAKVSVAKTAEPAPATQPVKAEPAAPKAEPAPAPAPAPVVAPQQTWWQEGLTELIKLICAILLIMASIFVKVLTKKYNVESTQAVLDDILHRAVSYVEQTTTAKLNAGAEKTPGAKKMEMAVEIAKKFAADTKLKDKGSEWWQTHLESWLGASGASKNGTEKPA